MIYLLRTCTNSSKQETCTQDKEYTVTERMPLKITLFLRVLTRAVLTLCLRAKARFGVWLFLLTLKQLLTKN